MICTTLRLCLYATVLAPVAYAAACNNNRTEPPTSVDFPSLSIEGLVPYTPEQPEPPKLPTTDPRFYFAIYSPTSVRPAAYPSQRDCRQQPPHVSGQKAGFQKHWRAGHCNQKLARLRRASGVTLIATSNRNSPSRR